MEAEEMTHEEAYKLLGLNQGRITIGGNSMDVAKFMEALAYAQDVLLNTDKIDPELVFRTMKMRLCLYAFPA